MHPTSSSSRSRRSSTDDRASMPNRCPKLSEEPRLGKVTQLRRGARARTISADDGSVLSFHCTSIANRQRRIPEGARVTFATVAGHLGDSRRWESPL